MSCELLSEQHCGIQRDFEHGERWYRAWRTERGHYWRMLLQPYPTLEWRMQTYLNDSPLTHELTIQLILACYPILSLLLENIFPLVLSSFCVSLLPSDNDHLDETTVHHLSLDLICIHTSIAIGFSFLYLHKTEIVFLLFLSLTIHTFKKKYLSLNLFHSDFKFW